MRNGNSYYLPLYSFKILRSGSDCAIIGYSNDFFTGDIYDMLFRSHDVIRGLD